MGIPNGVSFVFEDKGSPDFEKSILDQMEPFDKFENGNSLKVRRILGSGATGTVRKTKHIPSNKEYAVKSFKIRNEMDAKCLLTELRTLNKCTHDNVIRMYGAYYKESELHTVLEYMNLGSLQDMLSHLGPLPEVRISQIAFHILQGLSYLHDTGIIHRDIKPGNILLNDRGCIKIADFGMAGQKSSTHQDIFTTFQGSAPYMSPERIRGKPYSFSSDVWSLGVTVAECAIGENPLSSSKDNDDPMFSNIWKILNQITNEKSTVLNIPDSFSSECQQFIDRMTQSKESRASVHELLSDPFITQHNSSSTSSKDFKKWLRKTYCTKIKAYRQQIIEEERKRKQQLRNE